MQPPGPGATPGDGAVAQIDVTGLSVTAYDHYDSRAGDPHLHTHVVASNKVRSVLGRKWRSLDSRPLRGGTVALSELYEAVFADHPTRVLGIDWEPCSGRQGVGASPHEFYPGSLNHQVAAVSPRLDPL